MVCPDLLSEPARKCEGGRVLRRPIAGGNHNRNDNGNRNGNGSGAGPAPAPSGQTTVNPAQKASSRSIQIVLCPVAIADPSIDGMIPGWSPTVASASTRPMKRLPI